jgi:hypothetical protein
MMLNPAKLNSALAPAVHEKAKQWGHAMIKASTLFSHHPIGDPVFLLTSRKRSDILHFARNGEAPMNKLQWLTVCAQLKPGPQDRVTLYKASEGLAQFRLIKYHLHFITTYVVVNC